MNHPWHRQKGETPPAFEAFMLYRDLGAERSTDKVRIQTGKSQRLMERWSSRWRWVERAAAWDHHLDLRRLEAAANETEERARRHIAEAKTMQVLALQKMRAIEDVGKEMSIAEARQYMEAAIRLERLVVGEADSHTQVEVQIGGAVQRVLQAVLQEVRDPEVRARIADRLRSVSIEDNGSG